MSVTIFCTFEQQDFADFAAGRLKAPEFGVKSIHYVADYRSAEYRNAIVYRAPEVTSSADVPPPNKPVTMRIVCSERTAAAVRAKLVNLHGYHIVTS